MSFTVKNLYPMRAVFRLKPLVMAITLISPFGMYAADFNNNTAGLSTDLDSQNISSIEANSHRFHRDHVLGTSLDVVMIGISKPQAEAALNAIQTEVARLDQILSVWRDDSEISQLNRDKQIQASPELFEVIAACENWRAQSCGAFDARLGQLIALWEKSQGIVELDQQTRQQVLSQLKNDSVKLDAQQQSIAQADDITFAPDGYAKGYIIDRALAAARAKVPELQGILLDIGGDMRVWGDAPQTALANNVANNNAWSIGIQDAFNPFDNAVPTEVLNLKDQAVAVSGQGYRRLADQSHLLDPQTGLALQQVQQCVVVGQCAADADALATALAAMQPEEGLALIDALMGYEAKMTFSNGQVVQSSGWNSLVQPKQFDLSQNAEMQNVASSSAAKWPAAYQAVLEVNIPKIAVDNYRAPYVSVWVTDSDKKIVRTLAVWGKDEKWINSNYVWWRRYGRQMTNLDAVAKPSRQPGNYKLAWDGKDEQGKAVAAGQYQIHIETTREHGDHSYQSFNLDVKAKPSAQNLAAQKEIGALKLNFQKVN